MKTSELIVEILGVLDRTRLFAIKVEQPYTDMYKFLQENPAVPSAEAGSRLGWGAGRAIVILHDLAHWGLVSKKRSHFKPNLRIWSVVGIAEIDKQRLELALQLLKNKEERIRLNNEWTSRYGENKEEQ